MIDSGLIPDKGGVFIDLYNHTVTEGIAGTIVSGNHSSRHFITDKNMNENKKTKVTIVSDSGCSPVILINKRCYRIRKLTPRECFRLFGLREAEIDTIQAAGISNTQQYKMAGNSIVVDVLYHIFRKLLVETKADPGTQLELF